MPEKNYSVPIEDFSDLIDFLEREGVTILEYNDVQEVILVDQDDRDDVISLLEERNMPHTVEGSTLVEDDMPQITVKINNDQYLINFGFLLAVDGRFSSPTRYYYYDNTAGIFWIDDEMYDSVDDFVTSLGWKHPNRVLDALEDAKISLQGVVPNARDYLLMVEEQYERYRLFEVEKWVWHNGSSDAESHVCTAWEIRNGKKVGRYLIQQTISYWQGTPDYTLEILKELDECEKVTEEDVDRLLEEEEEDEFSMMRVARSSRRVNISKRRGGRFLKIMFGRRRRLF